MSINTKSAIMDWKRLWQLVCGIYYETPEKIVLEELLNVLPALEKGLLQCKSIYSPQISFEALLNEKKQKKLKVLTQRLQELLEISSENCWDIFCYYLMNEYRGTANSLVMVIATENNMSKLLDDIWSYYSLERIILLKIVKNLLIYCNDVNHPYHSEYNTIIEKIGVSKMHAEYLNQLEYLIKENPPQKLILGEFFNYKSKLQDWSERNAREIIETCHILLLLSEHYVTQLSDITRLFHCIKQHSFGREQKYFNLGYVLHAELRDRLAYSELAVLMNYIDLKQKQNQTQLVNDLVTALNTDISKLHDNNVNGPLLLSWMLMRVRCSDVIDNDEQFMHCRKMGKRAVDLNCFSYMLDMITHPMFNDDSLTSCIVRQTIYNNLCYMCDYFDGSGACAKYHFIYQLLSELLSWPSLAQQFCKQQDVGVYSLYSTLLEIFPIDFAYLSMIASALTKAGMSNYITLQLESLPILTDLYDTYKYNLKSKPINNATNVNEYLLMNDVQPFLNIDYHIPNGTLATITKRDSNNFYIHFHISVNYFQVLHNEIQILLREMMHGQVDLSENSERIKRINEGLKFLYLILSRTKSLANIKTEMIHPTEMCIDLLNKLKNAQHVPIELMANCLNVCTAVLPLASAEIYIRITNLSILPFITNDSLDNYKQFAQGTYLDAGLVGLYMVDVEKKRKHFVFLQAYLKFLRCYTKLQLRHYFHIEIPGLIFLLRDVFPHIHSWHFARQQDKYCLYGEIMSFICDILDNVMDLNEDDYANGKDEGNNNADINQLNEQILLRNICVYSMLNLENGMVLLRFISLGNTFLQRTMEMEYNWMSQKTHHLILLVRLAMRILMQVLKMRSCLHDDYESRSSNYVGKGARSLTPLEAMIYTKPKQRDTLRIIPVITSYMNNIFDRWLPILSCRLLKRIALEFDLSLLACLDMEAEQIRMIFLQKLPDELVSDSLKIAILEFIEACIGKQPGVTEAFFTIHAVRKGVAAALLDTEQQAIISNDKELQKQQVTQLSDNIITYLEDYLMAVNKDPLVVRQLIPTAIMNLFHTLWKQNAQLLVEPLIAQPKFWHKLCQPLFYQYINTSTCYTQLLHILTIEIYSRTITNASNSTIDELKEIILKMFEKENFEKWLHFLFDNMSKATTDKNFGNNYKKSRNNLKDYDNDKMPEWLCRIEAYKNLLMILLKKQTEFVELPKKQLTLLAEKCLTYIVQYSESLVDLRPLILIAELYVFILLNFKHNYTEDIKEDEIMLSQMIQLLQNLSGCFLHLHSRAKGACLMIAIKCTHLLADSILKNANVAVMFLESVLALICIQLELMELVNSTNYNTNCNSICNDKTNNKEMKLTLSTLTANNNNFRSIQNDFILALSLLKSVVSLFETENSCGNWISPFLHNKIISRLISCTSSVLQMASNQRLTVELLDVLIVFARDDNCSKEYLHCDIDDILCLKLLPPKELLQLHCRITPQNLIQKQPVTCHSFNLELKEEWSVQKWWPIYARGIQLMTLLLEMHSHQFLSQTLQFIGIHEECLVDSLLVCKKSLEPVAMNLIKSIVTLLASVGKYHYQWLSGYPQSVRNLMRAVQILLGHSINMFYEQKHLKLLIKEKNFEVECDGTDNNNLDMEVVAALNDLTEIIILCCKCLQHFSPPLMDLICESELFLNWEPIFEMYFGAPQLNDTLSALSFGTVLRIVGVYTKTLNLQNFVFHGVPINILPNIKDNENMATTATPTTLATSTTLNTDPTIAVTPMKTPTKQTGAPLTQRSTSIPKKTSIKESMLINSSQCPSDDVLANLDGELCLMALEYILTLIAAQCMLALKNPKLTLRQKQLIRREIFNELLTYQDYVRKKILRDYQVHICQRRKHGQILMMPFSNGDNNDNDSGSGSGTKTKSSSSKQSFNGTSNNGVHKHSNDLRINLVRKLHLQQQKERQQHLKNDFEMSSVISPISLKTSQNVKLLTSTPNYARSSIQRHAAFSESNTQDHREEQSNCNKEQEQETQVKKYQNHQNNSKENDDDIVIVDVENGEEGHRRQSTDEENYFPPDDSSRYSPLSYIQFVEEDYLHLLANIFLYICQSNQ